MHTSPISKITTNRDCFLTVFDIITNRLVSRRHADRDTYHDRPIVVVRAASQVCQQWRELLLSSTWIWGRLVDLGHTYPHPKRKERKEWMEEVVKRAGSSPLWVKGQIYKPHGDEVCKYFDAHDFFIRLLDGDLATWERIEMLSVRLSGQEIHEVILRCFLSRAPALKMFQVIMDDIEDQHPSPFLDHFKHNGASLGGRRLFADHAPLLQRIHTHTMIPVQHSLRSPWLPQIRELIVSPWVTLDDIYAILERTPFLESLVLTPTVTSKWRATSLGPLSPRPKANLPRLEELVLYINLTGCAKILEYLSSSLTKPSLLRLIILESESSVYLPDEIQQLKERLALYISHYFQTFRGVDEPRSSINPSEVLLGLRRGNFEFVGRNDYHPHHINFFIRTQNNYWDLRQHDLVSNSLLGSIVHATTLESTDHHEPETFRGIKRLVLDFFEVRPTLHQSLYSTLAVFNRVQSLETDEYGMDIIWEITSQHLADPQDGNSGLNASTQVQVLFPDLNVLYLTSTTKGQHTGLRRWLMKRKELGFSSMPKLDVRETDVPARYAYPWEESVAREIVEQDFSILEEVDGLEVIWKRLRDDASDSAPTRYEVCSYVCGSGDPAQLKDLPLYPKRQ